MTLKNKLTERLEYVDATRKERLAMAEEILENPGWFGPLLEIGLERSDHIGSRACWVVEFVCKRKLDCLFPFLDAFTTGLPALVPESSIRPMAKICELLAEACYPPVDTGPPLTLVQKARMVSVCFDWLIGPYKVAPKAYCMRTLYLMSADFPWVREALREELQLRYPEGSAAYKARARYILQLLEKAR